MEHFVVFLIVIVVLFGGVAFGTMKAYRYQMQFIQPVLCECDNNGVTVLVTEYDYREQAAACGERPVVVRDSMIFCDKDNPWCPCDRRTGTTDDYRALVEGRKVIKLSKNELFVPYSSSNPGREWQRYRIRIMDMHMAMHKVCGEAKQPPYN